jgi:hypothetical protein
MTASSSCKVIRCESYFLNKKAASCPRVKSAGYDPIEAKTNSNKSCATYGLGIGTEFDEQLLALERIARCQYAKILESLTFKKPPRWFDQMLDHSILPTLQRIGFEEPISKAVFKIASSSWKLMGPLSEKIVAFYPTIHQEIEEVRQGLALKTCKGSDMLPRLTGARPQRISGTIRDIASPENLLELINEIATPWIILPRASRFLQKSHCRYLPVYLKTIERETRDLCLKLFSRITVEFVGNFSLKFADRHHPPDQLAKLLFYGYSALFWKTLRRPPENMANHAAFDNFYNWIYRFVHRSDFLGNEELASVSYMLKMKTMIFPARNFSSPQTHCEPNISRFIVTLRHGCIGIVTILKYFGVDQFLETRQSASRFACPSIQKEVRRLLHIIPTKYHLESKQTRENIKLFIECLRSAYTRIQPNHAETEKKFLDRIFNHLQLR